MSLTGKTLQQLVESSAPAIGALRDWDKLATTINREYTLGKAALHITPTLERTVANADHVQALKDILYFCDRETLTGAQLRAVTALAQRMLEDMQGEQA